MQLCGDAFTAEQKPRNFDYYERITVRDSSLSACTQAVIAAEVGHLRLALDYLAEAALMDLHDLEHNARDGLHIASLAGTWIALVAGFGGLRDHGGILSFTPRLPDGLTQLSFNIMHRGVKLCVQIGPRRATYSLTTGGKLQLAHHGEMLELDGEAPVTRPIPPLAPCLRPEQPAGRAPTRRTSSES